MVIIIHIYDISIKYINYLQNISCSGFVVWEITRKTSANKLIYEYVKNQLGREDEEDLSLWSDVLYTLVYNEF